MTAILLAVVIFYFNAMNCNGL